MLNKRFYFSLFIFLMSTIAQVNAAPAVYAQLTSTADQLATPDTVNQPTAITLQSVDSISGMEWDNKSNKLLIKQSGIYVFMSSVQVGARESANNIIKGGDIYYWLELNSTMIPNTANWVFASPHSRSKLIGNMWITPLKSGDVMRFMFSSSAPSMGLVTIPPSGNIPNSPGLSLSVYMVNFDTIPTTKTL